jgi:hypothetical protein
MVPSSFPSSKQVLIPSLLSLKDLRECFITVEEIGLIPNLGVGQTKLFGNWEFSMELAMLLHMKDLIIHFWINLMSKFILTKLLMERHGQLLIKLKTKKDADMYTEAVFLRSAGHSI